MRFDVDTTLLIPFPTGIKTLWPRCLCVPTTSRRNVAKTSQWYFSTTFQKDVTTTSHQYVSTTSETSLNETPSNVSVARYQDVSVVQIHDVPLARLYNISCTSQIKHPKKLLWDVSTTSLSYVFPTSCW